MRKVNYIKPLQPYMVLVSENYQRVDENRLGISHCYQMDLSQNMDSEVDAVPDGCIDLVFCIDDGKVSTSIGGTVLKAKHWELGHGGTCFGIRFMPGSGVMPKELSPDMLVNQDIEIDGNIFGDNLVEKLSEQENMSRRAEIFMNVYETLIHDNEETGLKKRIVEYIRNRVCQNAGQINMSELAQETGYSECYLRRVFKEYNGISPKQFAQYIRFQNLLTILKNSDTSNENLALDCGYYDEAHMMKEFRNYAGMTIEQYKKIITPKKDLL